MLARSPALGGQARPSRDQRFLPTRTTGNLSVALAVGIDGVIPYRSRAPSPFTYAVRDK